ncbi:hypothetical protein M011DRAFT_80154 [Sporormia fimetaria CBS 119925]|uniref:Secreted protein n=1 Tax=Sporormia fimetaria CBS 119925 TaxID=1340428 RepID=A0A6A6VBA9_9PLEO|nr:hypothetical protein M011DRAFT_80154 [Sporormia fimetaria CBS 119925]
MSAFQARRLWLAAVLVHESFSLEERAFSGYVVMPFRSKPACSPLALLCVKDRGCGEAPKSLEHGFDSVCPNSVI